ncbi:hypothetical protein GLOTRDRAFT_134130 [Gloeophyllum trabeum ATCC 11539]|uniref:CCHC-type domain-containing protein n=1 Tax=Gloeophyllum trabeum (strain ATCC 11539 / FP-39264 / Madison 617) TaxID=670483 RepID=S7PR02_GLOTA|nr:uncharacterized protein GLOTRDRAFT_134130 [Gloeophyllum trabeum ATCC 11539]EPQ50261.1 hypothetical protein GLOTRDRAFT_134130 [Gloeophyllum trabeum ATCC 11539]
MVENQTLPLPGSSRAPKFKGKPSKVEEFLEEFEELAKSCNLQDNEKPKKLLRSCSRDVREVLETLPSYIAGNWDSFKSEVLKIYDHTKDKKRFRKKDLKALYRKTSKKSISSMTSVRTYTRRMQRVAGWLLKEQAITDKEYNYAFWKGLPKSLRTRLEVRILAKKPDIDVREPYDRTLVQELLERLFERDRFDADDSDDDDEYDSDAEDYYSDRDDDDESDYGYATDSDEDSDEEFFRSRIVRTKRKARKHKREEQREEKRTRSKREKARDRDTIRETDSKRTQAKDERSRAILDGAKADERLRKLDREERDAHNDDEVESLVKQLSRMSINDARYAGMYYRALKLDRDIVFAARPPYAGASDAPALATNPLPPIIPAPRPRRAFQSQTSDGEMICFGCGGTGHGLSSCPKILELLEKGVLKRDMRGKLVMSDGSRIQRTPTESIVNAVERQLARTHYVILDRYSPDNNVSNFLNAEYDSDSSDNEVFVMPAERGVKQGRAARKEMFDGVVMPPRSRRVDKRGPPGEKAKPEDISLVPIEVHERQYRPEREDVVMEDDSRERAKRVPKPGEKSGPMLGTKPEASEKWKRAIPLQSKISETTNSNKVLDKILSTPLTLSVGEVIGVSKDITHQLQDAIRYKRPTQPQNGTLVAHTVITHDRDALIKLSMECDGRPLDAIVDTGSQLNIVHKKVWQLYIRRPMDRSRRITMHDANGGDGVMEGLVQNVPLTCGGIRTWANLYVAEHAPFDLLLGRPWQRGNQISIDERIDGTYLIFNNPFTSEPRQELLVAPDRVLTNASANANFSYYTQADAYHARYPMTDTATDRVGWTHGSNDTTIYDWDLSRDARDTPMTDESSNGLPVAEGRRNVHGEVWTDAALTVHLGNGILPNGSYYEDYFAPRAVFTLIPTDDDLAPSSRVGILYTRFVPIPLDDDANPGWLARPYPPALESAGRDVEDVDSESDYGQYYEDDGVPMDEQRGEPPNMLNDGLMLMSSLADEEEHAQLNPHVLLASTIDPRRRRHSDSDIFPSPLRLCPSLSDLRPPSAPVRSTFSDTGYEYSDAVSIDSGAEADDEDCMENTSTNSDMPPLPPLIARALQRLEEGRGWFDYASDRTHDVASPRPPTPIPPVIDNFTPVHADEPAARERGDAHAFTPHTDADAPRTDEASAAFNSWCERVRRAALAELNRITHGEGNYNISGGYYDAAKEGYIEKVAAVYSATTDNASTITVDNTSAVTTNDTSTLADDADDDLYAPAVDDASIVPETPGAYAHSPPAATPEAGEGLAVPVAPPPSTASSSPDPFAPASTRATPGSAANPINVDSDSSSDVGEDWYEREARVYELREWMFEVVDHLRDAFDNIEDILRMEVLGAH